MDFRRIIIIVAAVGTFVVAIALSADKEPPPAPVASAPEPPPVVLPEPKQEESEPTIDPQILVAATDLPRGTKLTQFNFDWVTWPRGSVPAGAISKDEMPTAEMTIAGSLTRVPISRGAPILTSSIVRAGEGSYLSAALPAGMRAVAIPIDTGGIATSGGFVLPQDHVDVVRMSAVGPDVVLENILVLGIGRAIEPETPTDIAMTGETATLQVTPEQAQILLDLSRSEDLRLLLRPILDNGAPNNQVFSAPAKPVTVIQGGRSHTFRR